MHASALFHAKKPRKQKSKARASRSDDNPCCPVIRIKCKWPKGRGARVKQMPTLAQRLKAYSVAKAAMMKTASSGIGPRGPLGGLKNIIPGHTTEALANAARMAKNCTVTIGRVTTRAMTAAQATRRIGVAIRAQKAKRCTPKVERSR